MFAELAVTGLFYVRFADIRDSDKAYLTIRTHRREWNVQYILPKQFALKFHPEKLRLSPVSEYEGQVLVRAEYTGVSKFFDAVTAGHRIKEELDKFGDVIAFQMGVVKDSVAAYRAEYSNVNTVDNAVSRLNGSCFAVRSAPKIGYLQIADSRRCVL